MTPGPAHAAPCGFKSLEAGGNEVSAPYLSAGWRPRHPEALLAKHGTGRAGFRLSVEAAFGTRDAD